MRETLVGRLLHLAQTMGDKPALREKRLGIWKTWTWRDYAHAVALVARALHEVGVRTGDGVAILSDNRTEWVFTDLAAQGLGARAVGVYQTNPAADVAYILQDSGCTVLVCEDQEQVDKAVEVAAETPTVKRVVVLDPRGTRDYPDDRLEAWEEFAKRGHVPDVDAWFAERVAERTPDEATMVVYTSGTTGPPKGALISPGNAVAVADGLNAEIPASPKDTLLSYLPLCHVAEKIFTLFLPLASGAVVHFGESIDTVRQDIAEVSPTVFLGVPRIWEKMHASVTLKMKDSSWLKRRLYAWATSNPPAALRWLAAILVHRPLRNRLGLLRCRLPVTGAAPIAAELIDWFRGIGVPLLEGYGQTECAGVSHLSTQANNRLGAVGRILPGAECRIADDGEILVAGPSVFRGYLNRPDATAKTIVDGWLHTGDLGRIDEDGYLHITGRKKEIIITAGGKNLSPEKIENALKLSPYVKEAVAIGDQRKFISALIQIEDEAVGDWATRSGLTHTSYEELTGLPEVVKLVQQAVTDANAHLARVEQVRAFRIFPKPLSQDDGELTATQKVRRSAVVDLYGGLVDAIYGGGR